MLIFLCDDYIVAKSNTSPPTGRKLSWLKDVEFSGGGLYASTLCVKKLNKPPQGGIIRGYFSLGKWCCLQVLVLSADLKYFLKNACVQNWHKNLLKIVQMLGFKKIQHTINNLIPWGRSCYLRLESGPPTGQTYKDPPPHVLSLQALRSGDEKKTVLGDTRTQGDAMDCNFS